jgi:hypothetical protein
MDTDDRVHDRIHDAFSFLRPRAFSDHTLGDPADAGMAKLSALVASTEYC